MDGSFRKYQFQKRTARGKNRSTGGVGVKAKSKRPLTAETQEGGASIERTKGDQNE